MQTSPNIPFPALVLCSSAQLEPAVQAGQQPSATLWTTSSPRDRERALWAKRRAARSAAHPDSRADHEAHRASRSFPTLTPGTALNPLSLYSWDIFFPNNIIQMFSF